ncbi:MAG: DUF4410 domain-containing protein [Dongiaceae bacterium]
MIMRQMIPFAAILILLFAGCAFTNKEPMQQPAEDTRLPYPRAIYVYEFAVSPAELRPGSSAAKRLSAGVDDPQGTPKREKLERKIADLLATRLVANLQELGLPAVRWRGTPPKNKDAYIVEGQFLTIDEANALGGMIIGFGLGGAELRVSAQAYYLDGKRKKLLGRAEVNSETSKKPGLAAVLPAGAAASGAATAAAVSTGVGVVTKIDTQVRSGAEDTAKAIVRMLTPKMKAQGWL